MPDLLTHTSIHSSRDLLEPLEYLPRVGSQRRRRAAAGRGQLEEGVQVLLLPRPLAVPGEVGAERVGDLPLEDQVLEGGREEDVPRVRPAVVRGLLLRQQLEQNHPEAVDVALARGVPHLDQLGRLVPLRRRGLQHLLGGGGVQQEVEAVVRYLALIAGVKKNVACLEVAMNHRLLQACVQVIQSLGNADRKIANYAPSMRLRYSLCKW